MVFRIDNIRRRVLKTAILLMSWTVICCWNVLLTVYQSEHPIEVGVSIASLPQDGFDVLENGTSTIVKTKAERHSVKNAKNEDAVATEPSGLSDTAYSEAAKYKESTVASTDKPASVAKSAPAGRKKSKRKTASANSGSSSKPVKKTDLKASEPPQKNGSEGTSKEPNKRNDNNENENKPHWGDHPEFGNGRWWRYPPHHGRRGRR